MRRTFIPLLVLSASVAEARPNAPELLCAEVPEAPQCQAGLLDCATCHVAPPDLNVFGQALQAAMGPTSSNEDFAQRFADAFALIQADDADGDGVSNLDELLAGTSAAEADTAAECGAGTQVGPYRLCVYDPLFAARRVALGVCGRSLTIEETERLNASDEPELVVQDILRECLDSEYWQGVDGVLWQVAFPKVRPRVPFAVVQGAFEPDLNLFTYACTDDRDARVMLTATYDVERDDGVSPPRYTENMPTGPRAPDPARRAGMLTTTWFNASNTMGQAIPRVTAAQAYRAFMGFDISLREGLFDPRDTQGNLLELRDYDDKGIEEAECAGCHRTLDSLAYMFSRYAGAAESRVFSSARPRPPQPGRYAPNRMEYYVGYDGGPDLVNVPETGSFLGEPGYSLVQWARAAADSEPFAQNLVANFWRRLLGSEPQDYPAQFELLWRRFMTEHNYRVELMLEDLVLTEAFGEP